MGYGLGGALVYGIIQQLLGLSTLSYVTTWQSVVAVILLDYIIAFGVVGLGGLFRKSVPHQGMGLAMGSVLVCLLRYGCHVLSGATVWAGLSIPDSAALAYSFVYNATYMIPETIVLTIAAYYLGTLLDFRKEQPTRLEKEGATKGTVLGWVAGLLVSAALIFDVANIFAHLQDAETGEFLATGFQQVPWAVIGIVSAVAAVVAGALLVYKHKLKIKG